MRRYLNFQRIFTHRQVLSAIAWTHIYFAASIEQRRKENPSSCANRNCCLTSPHFALLTFAFSLVVTVSREVDFRKADFAVRQCRPYSLDDCQPVADVGKEVEVRSAKSLHLDQPTNHHVRESRVQDNLLNKVDSYAAQQIRLLYPLTSWTLFLRLVPAGRCR